MRFTLIHCLWLSLCLGPSQQAWAFEPAGQPNGQELRRPDYLPDKSDAHFELPRITVPPSAPPAGSGGHVLHRVLFIGNESVAAAELERVAAPWIGKPASEADLESLRLELTRAYVTRGFLNSGAMLSSTVVPEDGTLTFQIVEGRLAELRLDGIEDLDPDYVKTKLSPDTGETLNVNTLRERFQLLLDDPLFSRLNAQLSPGLLPGEAKLHIDAQRARSYQLSALLNNYRPPSIGEAALGLSGWLRNLTGRGDVLEGTWQFAPEGNEAYRAGLAWRLPLNYQGSSVYFQVDDGHSSVVEEPLRTAGITSRLKNWEAGISQVMLERLNHRLVFGLGLQSRESRTYLDGLPFSFIAGEPDGVTRAKTFKFWQEYAFRTERQVIALRSTFAHTANNLQPTTGLPIAPVQPDDRYDTWLGQMHFVRKLDDAGTQFILRLAMQRTSDRLLPLDGMSIGGASTVRGFRENQMIRDRGHIANLELDIPIVQNAGGHHLNLVPFLDYGKGRNQGESAATISSGGIAVRWRWQDLTLDLALAKRLSKPSAMPRGTGTLQDSGVHFQLAYRI